MADLMQPSSQPPHPSTKTPEISQRANPFAKQPRFPLREEVKIRVWTGLACAVLWMLKITTRKYYIGAADELFERWRRGEQVIMAFWHSRIILMRFAYQGQKACVMNSIHRDGEIVTRIMRRFGIPSVRGSSSRGWVGGLKSLVEAYRLGYDLIIVPDGPRGPRHQAKSGVLQLARVTGAPVYPTTYSAAWHTTIGSWDRLMIPFPFSRAVYAVGSPVVVPQDATPEQMEQKRQELEERLCAITEQADSYFKKQ